MVEKSNQKKIGTARKDLDISLGTRRYAMQVAGRVRDDNRRQLTREKYTSHCFFSFICSLLTQQDCVLYVVAYQNTDRPTPSLPPKIERLHCVTNK